MKVRIEKTFTDKYTGEKREAGSIVDFEDERAAELLADPRQVVSEVKEKGHEIKQIIWNWIIKQKQNIKYIQLWNLGKVFRRKFYVQKCMH